MSDLTAEELEVGRRNLLSQLRHDLKRDLSEYPVDAGTMRDLVEVLEGVSARPATKREYAIIVLVELLQEANRRDVAALAQQGYPGIPEVPDDAMRAHCGHLVDALIKAEVIA